MPRPAALKAAGNKKTGPAKTNAAAELNLKQSFPLRKA